MSTSLSSRRRSFLAVMAALLTLVPCLLRADPGLPPTPTAPPAPVSPAPAPTPNPYTPWLGNPGVDAPAARAHDFARRATALRWEADTEVAAYDRIGKKDPRWDDDAREALRQAPLTRSMNKYDDLRARLAQNAACARALQAGCDDPYILYWSLRLGIPPQTAGTNPADLARIYTRAEAAVAATDYPPVVKFYPAVRTAEKDLATRKAKQGWTGLSLYHHDEAAGWAEGTDIKTAYRHATAALEAMIADPAVPADAYSDVLRNFLDFATCDALGETEVLTPLRTFFESEAIRGHPTYSTKLAEGVFWIKYAWDARGGGYANTVNDEGWHDFGQRLEKAAAALEAAWKMDPAQPAAPREMVIVANAGPGDAEEWLRRTMDASPNDFEAASYKLNFLQPRWGGSEEAMLEFGHQCAATRDWLSGLPNILLDAHRLLSHDLPDKEQAAYWKRPDVWADLKNLYTEEFRDFGEEGTYDRTLYAWFAFRAGEWQTADEQFKLLGDHPDQRALDHEKLSLKRYHAMMAETAKHLAEATKTN